MSTVIEHVTYKLKAGTQKDALRATHIGVNNFCKAQQGFIYRSLSEDTEGLWHDIVYWSNQASADSAATAFMETEECLALAELCDKGSLQMRHMPVETEIFPHSLT